MSLPRHRIALHQGGAAPLNAEPVRAPPRVSLDRRRRGAPLRLEGRAILCSLVPQSRSQTRRSLGLRATLAKKRTGRYFGLRRAASPGRAGLVRREGPRKTLAADSSCRRILPSWPILGVRRVGQGRRSRREARTLDAPEHSEMLGFGMMRSAFRASPIRMVE
jgi:hypothetical protein